MWLESGCGHCCGHHCEHCCEHCCGCEEMTGGGIGGIAPHVDGDHDEHLDEYLGSGILNPVKGR